MRLQLLHVLVYAIHSDETIGLRIFEVRAIGQKDSMLIVLEGNSLANVGYKGGSGNALLSVTEVQVPVVEGGQLPH